MNIPTDLKHKPVIVSEDYDHIDGRYANNSDAKGLSLGLAQWNDRGKVEISAKIWRHSGKKWSRQSEEMPLHRVLDLAILICEAKKHMGELYAKRMKLSEESALLERIPLQGGAMNVAVCTGNEMIDQDLELFDACLHEDDELLSERLRRLAVALQELGI